MKNFFSKAGSRQVSEKSYLAPQPGTMELLAKSESAEDRRKREGLEMLHLNRSIFDFIRNKKMGATMEELRKKFGPDADCRIAFYKKEKMLRSINSRIVIR